MRRLSAVNILVDVSLELAEHITDQEREVDVSHAEMRRKCRQEARDHEAQRSGDLNQWEAV